MTQLATATLAIPIDGLTIVAPLPELVSQRNVEAATGISPRAYLDMIRTPGFPLSVIRVGKLRLVDRATFVAWLRSRGDAPTTKPAGEVEPDPIADVLSEVGLDVVKRPRRSKR